MMRDCSVWLGVLSSQLELCQVRKEDCGDCGGGECPLQEVDLRALFPSWQGKYKLRVSPSGCFDAIVGRLGNDCAERLGV